MGKSWSHRGVIVALTALSWILGTVITFGSSATAASAPAAPVVTAISPVEGPKQGGTVVRVTGTGFTGATKVLFGTVAGTSLTVHSATTLDITSPPH